MKRTVTGKGWREVMRKKMFTSNAKSEGKPPGMWVLPAVAAGG